MKNLRIYLLLLWALAIAFTGCQSPGNDPEVPQVVLLESIEASVIPFMDNDSDPEFMNNSFSKRYAAGQSMYVSIDSRERVYRYRDGKWIPVGTPVTFYTGTKYRLHISMRSDVFQDGTEAALLASDELFYSVDDLEPTTKLTGVKLGHTKVLVEMIFTEEAPSAQGIVMLGDLRTYKQSENKYYAIIDPDDKSLKVSYPYNGSTYEKEIDCSAGGNERLSFDIKLSESSLSDGKIEPPAGYENKGLFDGPFVLNGTGGKRTYVVRNPDGTAQKNEDVTLRSVDVFTSTLEHGFRVPLAMPGDAGWKLTAVSNKTLVVSDLHGEFEAFHAILSSQGVIDNNYNWSYGSNHLVFIGDIFDRGRNDVPITWLLYKLQTEATMAGGRVDLLVGNHEDSILKGTLSDMNSSKPSVLAGYGYSQLFGGNTELGAWIRNRNMVLQVNDMVFVHAGISPAIVDKGYTLEEMNRVSKQTFGLPNNEKGMVNPRATDLFQSSSSNNPGPIWYRGLVSSDPKYTPITDSDLDKVLRHYGISRMIVGHSEVDDIEWRFGGKVIAVNVQHRTNYPNNVAGRSPKQTAALVIENGTKFYSVDYKGNVITRFN